MQRFWTSKSHSNEEYEKKREAYNKRSRKLRIRVILPSTVNNNNHSESSPLTVACNLSELFGTISSRREDEVEMWRDNMWNRKDESLFLALSFSPNFSGLVPMLEAPPKDIITVMWSNKMRRNLYNFEYARHALNCEDRCSHFVLGHSHFRFFSNLLLYFVSVF